MYTSLNDVVATDVHDFTNASSSIQCCQSVCSLFSVWAYTRFMEYIMLITYYDHEYNYKYVHADLIMYMQICLKRVMYAYTFMALRTEHH